MAIRYRDPFVRRLFEDVAALIGGVTRLAPSVKAGLLELAGENSASVRAYWKRTEQGRGVPDSAYRNPEPLYLFPDEPPARIFRTSGTTGAARGAACYSPLGLELLRQSIRANACRHIVGELERPAMVRLAPAETMAPDMVMAFGMELISRTFGHPDLSGAVIGPDGLDVGELTNLLNRVVRERSPVVLMGGSLAFVTACEALELRGLAWQLPRGSRMVDAGGFKGRSRTIDVDALRGMVGRVFGIDPSRCVNLFGMTELASQLFDASDEPVGPGGERPKGREPFIEPRVRDPWTMAPREEGPGLLEVLDLCILDRPAVLLTGDLGIGTRHGVAIVGRAGRGETRGCSLALEELAAVEGRSGS
jgi:hypothetical protein